MQKSQCEECGRLRHDVDILNSQLHQLQDKYRLLSADHVALMKKYQRLASLLGVDSDVRQRPRPKRKKKPAVAAESESADAGPDYSKVLVVDIGSYQTKAGLSTDMNPTLVFDTVFDGVYPVKRGRCEDIDIYEQIFDRVYEELDLDSKVHPLIVCEVLMFPYPIKERVVDLLFTKYEVPAVSFIPHAVLNLFSYGIPTGVSVELGEGLTQIVPVYQGYGQGHAMDKMLIAGADVHDLFRNALKNRGVVLQSFEELEAVRKWKEDYFFVAEHFVGEVRKFQQEQHCTQRIKLPSGKTMMIGMERFMAPEVYFSTDHLDIPNLPKTIARSIQKCSVDLRRELWGDILISGGCSKISGFKERLTAELMKLAPSPRMVKVRFLPQDYTVFTGAVCFAKMKTFPDEVFTEEDFLEEGPGGVHKKRRLTLEQLEITSDDELD